MKFDFCIGNPPYQSETVEQVSETNGQAPRKNVFHYFQIEADKIASDGSVLIYPGGRWIHRSGKGLQQFGKDQINDQKLSSVEFYPDASEVFGQAAELSDGVTIVLKKKNKYTKGFNYSYVKNGSKETVFVDCPGDDLMPLNPKDLSICKKIKAFVDNNALGFLNESILPRSLFGIESDFVSKNPTLVRPLDDNAVIDYKKEIKLFTNDKAGKAGRARWYIAPKNVITQGREHITNWKIIVSSANAGGQKRDNQIELVDNHSAFGRSRVALFSSPDKHEAQNFLKYANSYFVKFAFLLTDEALTSLGKLVPHFNNYSAQNPMIDFSMDIDLQMNKLLGLSNAEIKYIQERVDNIRKKGVE